MTTATVSPITSDHDAITEGPVSVQVERGQLEAYALRLRTPYGSTLAQLARLEDRTWECRPVCATADPRYVERDRDTADDAVRGLIERIQRT